jgi:hypothetical protein
MFKVIEKKFFILLLVVLSMVLVPFLAQAGGHGGMGKTSKHGSSTYTYYTGTNRLGSYLGTYPNYYSNYYSPFRTNSVIYPSTYTSPYNYGSLYSYGGLNPWNYGQQEVVTGKEYTQEQSFTRYVPGGEITTTIGEDTETTVINPYGNLYNYNYGLGTGYLGNTFGYGYNPYQYNYGYNNLYNNWLY